MLQIDRYHFDLEVQTPVCGLPVKSAPTCSGSEDPVIKRVDIIIDVICSTCHIDIYYNEVVYVDV